MFVTIRNMFDYLKINKKSIKWQQNYFEIIYVMTFLNSSGFYFYIDKEFFNFKTL